MNELKFFSIFFACLLSLSLALLSCGNNTTDMSNGHGNGSPPDINPDPGTPSTTYTVSFNSNGGNGTTPSSQTVNAYSSITLPSGSSLSRSGYTFGGWNTSSSGTEINYPAGASLTVTGNIYLFAKWNASTVISYTVSFDGNGGSGSPPSSITVNAGQSITLPGHGNLSRTGYTFGGWNTSSVGVQINNSEGSSYTPTGNVTLYAKWNDNAIPAPTSYTITFSPSPPSPITIEAGRSITLPTPSSRTGYIFIGWSFNADGSGAPQLDGSIITPSGNFTLYAIWEEIIYRTVTFHINGGTGTVPSPITKPDGESITLPVQGNLSKTGHNFGGWNTQADGKGVRFFAGSTITPSGNITLYAHWIDITPTVTSITVSPATTSVEKGKTQSFSATVIGTNNPAQTVTWSIDQTNKHSGTTINSNGLLTVSPSETLSTLTVRSTSTVDATKSGEATVSLTTPAATVTSVVVSPATASVAKGGTQSFSATVTGTNSPLQTVSWSIVQAGKHSSTTISASGLLTVSASETLTTLTVRATSTVDNAKSGEATVNVPVSIPTAPTNVTATATSSSSIVLSWSAVPGATGYKVYRDKTVQDYHPEYTTLAIIGTTSSPSFTNTGLLADTTYNYAVSAYNNVGESSLSSPSPPWVKTPPSHDGTPGLAFEFFISNYLGYSYGTAYMVRKGTVTSGEVKIPATYNGLPVVYIESEAFFNTNITAVTLSSNIYAIGPNAFWLCKSLTSINIPSSVIAIGPKAFSGCTSLTSISIPSSVTDIGDGAFNGTAIISITIPSGVTSIGARTFEDCTNLTSISLPSSVTSIGDDAFRNCTSLVGVSFPPGSQLENIGSSAFRDCTNLNSITIPSVVTSIGSGAFNGCRSLVGVSFVSGSRLKNIGDNAFTGCTNLATMIIPSGVISIGGGAFARCTNIADITIPSNVMSVGWSAFSVWSSSQVINVQGHANQVSADTTWGASWRTGCNAIINYQG